MANKVKAVEVPLSDRTFIIGDAELMGYVGVKTTAALKGKFLNRGLVPTSVIGKTKYYRRTMVDRFIVQHDEQGKMKRIKLL
jgi:hypothetical protein